MGGRIILDLTSLSVGPHTYRIDASVALGQLIVLLPPHSSVEVHATVGAGATYIFGSSDGGTGLDNRYVRHHQLSPTYVLDLEAGIGDVEVQTNRRALMRRHSADLFSLLAGLLVLARWAPPSHRWHWRPADGVGRAYRGHWSGSTDPVRGSTRARGERARAGLGRREAPVSRPAGRVPA